MALIYHTDTWAYEYGSKLAHELQLHNINITNEIDNRVIDTRDPAEVPDEVINSTVTHIWDTDVRMIITILPVDFDPLFDMIL